MASGLRLPGETKTGRLVRPTEKARLLLVDAVWKTAGECAVAVDHAEGELVKAVKAGKPRRLVHAMFEAWMQLRSELEDTVQEFWDLANDEEQAERETLLNKQADRLQATVDYVSCYLKGDIVKTGSNVDLQNESVKLDADIEELKQKISLMNAPARKSKSAADPSWVTVSQTSGTGDRRPAKPPRTADSQPAFLPTHHSSPCDPTPTRPTGGAVSTTDRLLEKLTDALTARREQLPKLEPELFSGDMLKFPMWISAFEALIEKHTDSSSERLFFLGKYTAGEAREAIGGYLTLYAEDAYPRAKRLLIARYGDRLKVAQAYRAKLFSWKPIKKSEGASLQKYADFLWQCNAAMTSVGHLDSLNSAEENARMVKILPQYIIDKWFRIVDRWYYRENREEEEDEQGRDDAMFPPFCEFCRLVSTEARIVTGPAYSLSTSQSAETTSKSASPSTTKPGRRAQALATSTADVKPKKVENKKRQPIACFFCEGPHYLNQCDQFLAKPVADRRAYASENYLCFGCLSRGHGFRNCTRRNPDLLNEAEPREQRKATTMNTQITSTVAAKRGEFFSMIVPVRLSDADDPTRSEVVYALLDTQSDTTFIADDAVDALRLSSESVELRLVTMGSTQEVRSRRVRNLKIENSFSEESVLVSEAFTREKIPASRGQLPDPEVTRMHRHLEPMVPYVIPLDGSVPISLLIGNDQPAAFVTQQLLYHDDYLPYGVRTRLGWSLMGRRGDSSDYAARCFGMSARVVNVGEIAKAFDLEFNEVKSGDECMSYDDQLFMQSARDSTRVREDGHLEMDLPFRSEPAIVPDNSDVAMKRLSSVGRKMKRNPEFGDMYRKFMNGLVEQGYAELAPSDYVEGQMQFMPHHAVVHPRKPGEVRGVFDAAAEKDGVSLNKLLLPGPDMTNNLLGVLCNFRTEAVAFMCDIRKMFLQVGVSPKHRDYLRYLWYEDGDPTKKVLTYRMKAHSFGATSSPACASYALKELATINRADFGQEVVDFIHRHFYVDDGLKATETVAETVQLFMRSHEMCKRGGFWLHKFNSNSAEALKQIPAELRAAGADEGLLAPTGGVATSLGMTWDRVRDAFVFLIKEFTKQMTRRGCLSALSGVYDPVGFLAPTILVGRLLLQELCSKSLPWDEPLDEHYEQRWVQWYDGMKDFAGMRIPRCLRRAALGELMTVEMHHFCDASSRGYGACCYLKLVDVEGNTDVSLILAKARVGPKKAVTIPRLELQSAVLVAKMSVFLEKEMTYTDIVHWYWSDSKVALGYISNQQKKFQLYVANRVQAIRDRTEADHWNHVPGVCNPADLASRGVSARDLRASSLWWRGPDFLLQPTAASGEFELSDDDPEIKLEKRVVLSTAAEESWISRLVDGCGSLFRLLFRVAVLRRFVLHVCGRPDYNRISRRDISEAMVAVVRATQRDSFAEEMTIAASAGYPAERQARRERNRQLRKSSRLHRLDVFVDDRGVLRVGGRLRRAYLPVDVRHPAVLPKISPLTRLVLLHAHLRSYHAGRQQTLTHLREDGLWVLQARAAVDGMLAACVTCHKLKSAPMEQKMADLPDDRVKESPPFTFCGVDLFGPVTTKEGRSLKKRWVCLVTCMASRAVHLEPVYSLSTDSFMNAIRRVMNRRGPIQKIYCDQGTNFVGASNELKACLREMSEDPARQEMLKAGCDWVDFRFNPPTASHMGGVWERMVRSAKLVMVQLMSQYGEWVSDEMLWTICAEVEGTLNNRPITCVDVLDPWGEPPLTPARLLTQKYRGVARAPGDFSDAEIYSRKAWRQVQSLADRFWRRWRAEFLPDLQLRKKWNNKQFNLKAGDIVLMVDKDLKRNQWPLARVEEPLPSADGLVRSARIRLGDSTLERPIAKLIFLCAGDE